MKRFLKELFCCHVWQQTELKILSATVVTYSYQMISGSYKKKHTRKGVHETCLKCDKKRIYEICETENVD